MERKVLFGLLLACVISSSSIAQIMVLAQPPTWTKWREYDTDGDGNIDLVIYRDGTGSMFCVDRNNDGVCKAPPDEIMGDIHTLRILQFPNGTVRIVIHMFTGAQYTFYFQDKNVNDNDTDDVGEMIKVKGKYRKCPATRPPVKIKKAQGRDIPFPLEITNEGETTESFNVTLYVNNSTVVQAQTTVLANGTSSTLDFLWITTSFHKGNYTLSTSICALSTGYNFENNGTSYDRWVFLTLPGMLMEIVMLTSSTLS